MTFRARLLAAVTALTLVTLGGAFTAVYFAVAHSDLRQLDRVVEAVARTDVLLTRAPISPAAPTSMSSHGVSLMRHEAIYRHGQTVSATPGFSPPSRASLSAVGCCFDVRANVVLRAALVPVPGQPGVEMLVGLPRTDLDSDMALLRRSMLMVYGAAVAWTVLLAFLIVGRLTRGHRRIAAVARRVAGGDLDARVGSTAGSAEVAQLGQDIDEMIDRLAVLVVSQQQFIGHAAHELRSPLTTLYGELSLAARREREPAEYRATIDEALASTRSLMLLAEDLLALARIGSAGPMGSARHAVRAILEQARAAIPDRATIVVTGGCRDVKGSADDLARLLRNLLENAVRHSPEGAPIAIDLADRDSVVTITVSDQGPGVAESEAERIFAPFYRAPHGVPSQKGAGLGLAIARAIARRHGGDLRCRPGSQGGVFVVELPAE